MKTVLTICLALVLSAVAGPVCAAEHQILVSPQWVSERLSDTSFVILHLANLRSDYTRAHIPGAVFLWQYSIAESTPERSLEPLPVSTLDSVLEEAGVSNSSHIILCHVLGDAAAVARAYITLDWLGLGDCVYILDGGFEAWKKAGFPVTKEVPTTRKGDFTPRIQPSVFADLDHVRAKYRAEGVRLIDGRSAQAYNLAGGVAVFRGGHIPGAVNIPYAMVIDSASQYRPLDSIRAKIVEAGIKPGDELISYCAIGRTACPFYVAAKSLGYKARLYDGSFEEWSRVEDLPVEITPPKLEEAKPAR